MTDHRAPDRRRLLRAGAGLGAAALAGPLLAAAARPALRMAFIDPLSGPAAAVGRNGLRSWEFMTRALETETGLRWVVAGFDNKGSPQESLHALKVAIDQGFRFIVQGNGSGVTAALSEAIARHNQLRPDRAVLLVNYAAMDPALTGEHCSPWHFRIDADTSMKLRAMTRFMGRLNELKKVFLINQNYAHGQQFSTYFKTEAAVQAPQLQVVGEDLHGVFTVDDFRPFVQRIRASGAQAIATGNWGADLTGLVQAMQAESLFIPLWTYYAHVAGCPELLAASGERLPVYLVATGHSNPPEPLSTLARRFRQQHGEDLVLQASFDGVRMLGHAVRRAGSTDPLQVARALDDLHFDGANGAVWMRAEDHQLQTRVCVSHWQKLDSRHPVSVQGTGFTFAPVQCFEVTELAPSLRCSMPRL